jgi:hypothetical protein
MAAIGFLLVMLGITALIVGFHGQTLWGELTSFFTSGSGSKANT